MKRQAEALLILGNGFDLHLKLKSKFEDFLSNYYIDNDTCNFNENSNKTKSSSFDMFERVEPYTDYDIDRVLPQEFKDLIEELNYKIDSLFEKFKNCNNKKRVS